MEKAGTVVALLHLGGPRSLSDLPAFLTSLTGRPPTEALIADATERYRAIGGSSPLPRIGEEQARSLAALLGHSFSVLTAFRHSRPTIEETIDSAAGASRLVFLVMAPFSTSTTTGSYTEAARRHLARHPTETEISFIEGWSREPLFVELWVERLREEGGELGSSFCLFSAHGLPESLSREPYREQVVATTEAIARRLALSSYSVAWQSIPRAAREPWFGPSVEEVMERAARAGARRVVQAPIGFVTDNLETLYDIDITHRACAASLGLEHVRISTFNASPRFIRLLRKLVLDHEGQP